MQNRIYICSVLLAAASPALSQYNPAPAYLPIPPAPVYSAAPPPVYSAAPVVPVYSTAPVMPSITTTKTLTSALTVTSFLTVTSSAQYGTGDIIGPIEELAQCSQTIIFDCLQDSKCNPADFPCICAELKAHDLDIKITASCPNDKDEYLAFAANVCNNVKPTPKPSSSYPVYITSSVAPPMNTTYPALNATSSAAPPAPPAPVPATSVIVVTSTDAAGQPTTLSSTVGVAPVPTVAPPPVPEYTGAAVILNVQNAILAGGVGFMGLVFAGL